MSLSPTISDERLAELKDAARYSLAEVERKLREFGDHCQSCGFRAASEQPLETDRQQRVAMIRDLLTMYEPRDEDDLK